MGIATYKDLCIDVSDGHRMADFWASALGLSVVHDSASDDARLDGREPADTVWINVVPEPRSVKQRVHLDVHGGSVEEFESWGARRLSAPGEFPWTVLADPEGGELCVFVREQVPPRRLYELGIDCVDSGPVAGWWAEVFGTRCVADDRGYHWIDDIPGFTGDAWSFVPVPEPKTVKNRIHWDVTVGSVDDLLSIGATVLRERDDEIAWTVLADPEGNEFCAFVDPVVE